MAESSPNDLNYGHFGQALFSLENGAWNFGRKIGQRSKLTQLGLWQRVLVPAASIDNAAAPEPSQSVRSTQLLAKALGRSNPTLLPSLQLFPKLAIASAAITSISSMYDPAIGPLLSIGSFTSQGHYDSPRRVAALPAGECGNILRLVALTKQKHGWTGDKSIWIEGSSITNEDSGYWVEDAAPIQQVCFAQGDDRSTLLAVRLLTRTAIFRPIYWRNRIPPKRSQYYQLPYSTIDPQFILDIPIEKTGGIPHADVTFNPDYQRQVGLVDQKGNWSIWELDGGKKKGKSYTITCAAKGCMTLREPEELDVPEDKEALARDDGWARILWIGDVNTVLVCNRRTLGVFDIGAKVLTSLKCTELIPKRSADWILDVKRHPKNKHQFYILTSSRLFLLAITCLKDVSGDDDNNMGASVLVAWAHFQGSEDITLQLSVPTTSDEDSMVFMHSRLNDLVMVFRFQDSESDSNLPFSSSDPIILHIDKETLNLADGLRHITSLHVEQLLYGKSKCGKMAGAGHQYLDEDVRFYRLSAMLSDLSIYQTILYSNGPETESTGHPSLDVQLLAWDTVLYPYRHVPMDTLLRLEDDDFLVPEGAPTAKSPTAIRLHQTSKMMERRTQAPLQNSPAVDFGFLYDGLTMKEAVTNGETGPRECEDVSEIINIVMNLLTGESNAEEVPRGSLLEFADAKIKVLDVDEASSNLRRLFHIGDHAYPLELRQMASARVLHLSNGNEEALTISFLYDMILQYWIAPLPIEIPARVRQSKELLARRIATEVLLASIRIRRTESAAPTQPLGPSQDSDVSLPILSSHEEQHGIDDIQFSLSQPRPGGTFSDLVFASSSLPQTALPTPSPTPSFLSSLSISTSHSNPMTRLSQHLQIRNLAPAVLHGVSQILKHWTPGVDPRTYDWDATTRVTNQHLDGEDEMNERERRKLERKKERLRKRQKREEELSQRGKVENHLFSDPVFMQPRSPKSSPGPIMGMGMGMGIGMSSQAQTQSSQPFVVQSQVEPGRHGGRPKMKKKGKTRMSGF